MPHAVEDATAPSQPNEPNDDEQIRRLLAGENIEELENIDTRDLDLGEKANDAQDFEDIGDDDLADDDDALSPARNGTVNTFTDGQPSNAHAGQLHADVFEDDGLDDLFGDKELTPPPTDASAAQSVKRHRASQDTTVSGHDRTASFSSNAGPDGSFARDDARAPSEADSEEDAQVREQRELFAQAQREREDRLRRVETTAELPPAPPADSDLFSIIWPHFEPDNPPRFSHLFPGKRAQYIGKTPIKPPKQVHPTKVNLDLDIDQEKDFRLPGTATAAFLHRQAKCRSNGVFLTDDFDPQEEESEEDDLDSLKSEDLDDVPGYKWQDLVAVCQEWNIPGSPTSTEPDVMDGDHTMDAEVDMLFAEDNPLTMKQGQKRKLDPSLHILHSAPTTFEDPEYETTRLAKRVRLDLNDPHILVDVQQPLLGRERKVGLNDLAMERDKKGGSTHKLLRRYNISNDDAYDMLKENRQSKTRGTLGSLAAEHAMPAARLQYPFYKIKLSAREARSFHRPSFAPEPGLVYFEKLRSVKRKLLKGLGPQTIFANSDDLTQGDNSNGLLLEYSEEYPIMMSSFGMGNRLINYYRRRDDADTNRPKLEIGETEVLLSQDKSPFSIFGDVNPGHVMPAITNGMYRAPVFKHEPSAQDFLLISNRTGVNGRKWFLKGMENLHVVGQQFPSVEVPGTHSRKVTDASKKRLRMLSYRLFRHYKKLKNEMILRHIPGSDVAQNRSKMREFMNYDKDRGWLPRESEVPDEATVRGWIKPEDVCLLDSMQVGDQQLQDAGYNKGADDFDEDEDEKQGQSIDEQLAPWQTTKNFLNACQGKAMLQLHGDGDPTGRGEAFNFIRTSMKGGFKEIGESVEDRLSAQNQKELGGHSYNVAKQQKKYNDTIRRIWDAQRSSLSSTIEHDADMEDAEEQGEQSLLGRGRTPSSAVPGRGQNDDETGSVFSRTSMNSQGGRVLRITRRTTDKNGKVVESHDVVRDLKVIREYLRRRRQNEIENKSMGELKYTGNAEMDGAAAERISAELQRLYKNRERREAREKAKGTSTNVGSPAAEDASSPVPDGSAGPKRKNQTGGTQRKCANCGQIGHIKTNKKLCPLLNGTIKQDEGFGDSAFGAISASTTAGDETPVPSSAGFG